MTVRLLKGRGRLLDADFCLMGLALNRARRQHPFYLTAWVFLPDHWHAICAPVYPRTISLVMKSFKASSTILINRRRGERGELWQARFFDRALRTVKEYNEKVEYIHLNPVKAGLVQQPEEWPWSSVREYSGTIQIRTADLTTGGPRYPLFRMAKSRWEIENQGFNDAKNHYSFEHICHHQPNSLLVGWLLTCLALVIERLYRIRYLRRGTHPILTAIAFWQVLWLSLSRPDLDDTS